MTSPDELPAVKEFPDPFAMKNGERVETQADWDKRREEIKALLLFYQYGYLPPPPGNVQAAEISSTLLPGSQALEKRLRLTCGPHDAVTFYLNLIIPKDKPGPFPVLLTGDRCWRPAPIPEEIVGRGYLLAEFDRTEIARDETEGKNGVYGLYPDYDWAALAAWAWAYQCAVDYLTTRSDVDAVRIAITGHSRGGKAALLAGALDERIALTAPNNSGCGGAGSYRFAGAGSEQLGDIVRAFPYWFHPRLQEFVGQEERLPFDQHFLLALVAPRALLITNALGDLWANPAGTQQTYLAAKPAYEFLGAGSRIGNHYREGKHEHNADDWRTLLDFADVQFFGRQVETKFDGMSFGQASPEASASG